MADLAHDGAVRRALRPRARSPRTPKGNWLVYNGEIFNYYDLKQRFKNIGFAGITGCDTELLAWGLDTFGAKFVHEIDSMHAFAYYQPKKNKLILIL